MLALKDLHVQEVVQITQDNMVRLMSFWNELSDQYQAIQDHHTFRVQSHMAHPLFNNIIKTTIETDIHENIKTIIQHYKNQNLPLLWSVWDHDTPKDLGEILLENGGQQIPNTILMALDLTSFQPVSELYPGLIIKSVRNAQFASDFTNCASTTFEIPSQLSETLTGIFSKQDDSIENFVAYLNQNAVSCASLFYGNGIAGIYNVATLPDFQGKGIGVEIMTAALLKAKLDGFNTAILHASPAGLRLYEKLGFQKYGEMRQYLFL